MAAGRTAGNEGLTAGARSCIESSRLDAGVLAPSGAFVRIWNNPARTARGRRRRCVHLTVILVPSYSPAIRDHLRVRGAEKPSQRVLPVRLAASARVAALLGLRLPDETFEALTGAVRIS